MKQTSMSRLKKKYDNQYQKSEHAPVVVLYVSYVLKIFKPPPINDHGVYIQIFDQIFGQVFDQIFGPGF